MILSPRSFPGRTGRGVRIAVVDSGVHASHPHVGGVSGGVSIGPAGEIGDDFVDRLGHGTAVAAAIREKAPECELLVVKVFDRSLSTTGQALVAAIEWAARQRVHLINLSLGTTNQEHTLAFSAAIAKATDLGAIVVSAAPQQGAPWLPGGLPGVVAVDVDWDCPRDECRVLRADSAGVKIVASGYPRPIPGVPPERNFSGLSFAVANATGLLALMPHEGLLQTIAALAGVHSSSSAQCDNLRMIRRGAPGDAAALAELAARTFRETFGADTPPEDMALHLAQAYGIPQQQQELADADITTLLVELDGHLAGYAQLRSGETPECVAGDSPVELWRFYVAQQWHGRGVAQALMKQVESEAWQRGGRTLWLGVWERNARAKAFYQKSGFADVGSHTFMVGTDAQIDRILVKPLKSHPSHMLLTER